MSLASIRDGLGDRSIAALLVLFAAFNMIPLPPGASAVLGLPLLIVAGQMALGSRRAWLPGFVMNRSISAEQFRMVVNWAVPRLIRLEEVVRPRYWPFWRRRGERVVGFIALIMAIVVTLPIPLGNWLPACTTALLGLSLVERDGILLAIAGVVGIAALIVTFCVVGAAGFATHAALGWMF